MDIEQIFQIIVGFFSVILSLTAWKKWGRSIKGFAKWLKLMADTMEEMDKKSPEGNSAEVVTGIAKLLQEIKKDNGTFRVELRQIYEKRCDDLREACNGRLLKIEKIQDEHCGEIQTIKISLGEGNGRFNQIENLIASMPVMQGRLEALVLRFNELSDLGSTVQKIDSHLSVVSQYLIREDKKKMSGEKGLLDELIESQLPPPWLQHFKNYKKRLEEGL